MGLQMGGKSSVFCLLPIQKYFLTAPFTVQSTVQWAFGCNGVLTQPCPSQPVHPCLSFIKYSFSITFSASTTHTTCTHPLNKFYINQQCLAVEKERWRGSWKGWEPSVTAIFFMTNIQGKFAKFASLVPVAHVGLGTTKPTICRLAHHGGVKHISGLIYE
jgi:hypothetical protein